MTQSIYRVTCRSAKLDGDITLDFGQSHATENAATQLELVIPLIGDNVNADANIDHYVNAQIEFARATRIPLSSSRNFFDQDKALHVVAQEKGMEPSAILKKLVESGYITSAQAMDGFKALSSAIEANMQPHLDAIAQANRILHEEAQKRARHAAEDETVSVLAGTEAAAQLQSLQSQGINSHPHH